MGDDQVFLKMPSMLAKIKETLANVEGAILEVGAGDGSLTDLVAPKKVFAVEMDPRYAKMLENKPNVTVICEKIQELSVERFKTIANTTPLKTFISNLPFNQIMDILIFVRNHYGEISDYYVIVPERFFEKFKNKSVLGLKIRHLFELKKLYSIAGSCFIPKINFNTVFLHLKPTLAFDLKYLSFLSRVKRPHRKLKQVCFKKQDLDQPALKDYFEKRLNTISDSEMYEFYLKYKNFKTT